MTSCVFQDHCSTFAVLYFGLLYLFFVQLRKADKHKSKNSGRNEKMKEYTIRELSEMFGLPASTIRYYEDEGF